MSDITTDLTTLKEAVKGLTKQTITVVPPPPPPMSSLAEYVVDMDSLVLDFDTKAPASHLTSNGMDQLGDTTIGAEINFPFCHSNALKHSSSSRNFTYFTNKIHKKITILEKSLMNP